MEGILSISSLAMDNNYHWSEFSNYTLDALEPKRFPGERQKSVIKATKNGAEAPFQMSHDVSCLAFQLSGNFFGKVDLLDFNALSYFEARESGNFCTGSSDQFTDGHFWVLYKRLLQ
jgi:hypothetical protein